MAQASPVVKWLCYLVILAMVAGWFPEVCNAMTLSQADTNSGIASQATLPGALGGKFAPDGLVNTKSVATEAESQIKASTGLVFDPVTQVASSSSYESFSFI